MGLHAALLHMDIAQIEEFNLDAWTRSMLADAKFTFFIGPLSEVTSINSLSFSDYLFAILFALVKVLRQIHGYHGEIFLFCVILTLWMRSFAFYKQVKICNTDKFFPLKSIDHFRNLHQEYTALKQFSSLVNQVISFQMLLYIITSVLYFSSNLDGLIITSNLIFKIRAVSFHIHATIIYLIAADIPYRVKAFTDWISDLTLNQLDVFPGSGLAVVLHDVNVHRVGITGNNVFTITYTFLANVNYKFREFTVKSYQS